jgi:hypothetical protein
MTFVPELTAMLIAAWPKDEEALRMTSVWPGLTSRLRNRHVRAVAQDTGIAARSAHERPDSMDATLVTVARAYSANCR